MLSQVFDVLILTALVCERYALLPNDKKAMIAGELDRSVREIERKVSVSEKFPILLGFS